MHARSRQTTNTHTFIPNVKEDATAAAGILREGGRNQIRERDNQKLVTFCFLLFFCVVGEPEN